MYVIHGECASSSSRLTNFRQLAVLLGGTPGTAKLSVMCKKRLHAFEDGAHDRRRRTLELVNAIVHDDHTSTGEDRQAVVNELILMREKEARSTQRLRAVELACQVTVANLPNIGAAVSMCILQVQGLLNSGSIVLTLTSFHAIRVVISPWPRMVSQLWTGRRACRRAERILSVPEASSGVDVDPNAEEAVRMVGASFISNESASTFSISSGEKLGDGDRGATKLRAHQTRAHFENLSLSVGKTECIAVVARSVPASKYMATMLLGQLKKIKGKPCRPGRQGVTTEPARRCALTDHCSRRFRNTFERPLVLLSRCMGLERDSEKQRPFWSAV